MENWLTLSPWPGMLIWTLFYLGDYWMTIRTARMFRASPHIEFEGSLELTPQFEKDVDALKPVSRRHLVMLVITNLILLVIWWLLSLLGYLPPFAFFLGMFILMEAGIHLRHFRSYYMLTEDSSKGGLEGKVYYRRWYVLGNSAFEFLSLAVLFLFTALLTRSWFFTGGALSCLSVARNHYVRSRRLYALAAAAASGTAGPAARTDKS